MYEKEYLDLQLFAEGGDGGDGSGAAGSEGEGSAAEIRVGDVLPDGTVVDENLASSMRENADLYSNLAQEMQARAQAPGQDQGKAGQQAGKEAQNGSTREEWEAVKKQFAQFYGEDVHATIDKRFKNQADATKQLEEANRQLERQNKVLNIVMKHANVSNFDELEDTITSDELEAEASEKDIPVEVLRQLKDLEAANAQHNEEMQQAKNREYINGLIQQGQELQKIYPDFDIIRELNENPRFVQLTSPAVGLSVEEAFNAIHGKDMQAQILAYGVQAGKDQTAKAIRANGMRPVEGANRGGRSGAGTAAAPNLGAMSDEQYEAIKARTMRGEHVTL